MFSGGNIVVAGGTFNFNEPQRALRTILQTFGACYVPTATHDNNDVLDAPKCHPGTRTSFLTRLSNWVQDPESPVYLSWLYGPAGAGKSAIARSLADKLHGDRLLAGSFFFFRMDEARKTEKPFMTTLAYQIACNIPETQPYIANAIEADPAICSRSLQTQFKTLLLEPLERVTESNSLLRPMLIIVDGLDECANEKAKILILTLVFEAVPRLRGYIKFLIVSRPEYDIQRSFDSASASFGQHVVNTIELTGDLQAYEDVRIYLRDNFHRINQTHPLRGHFPPNWPSVDAVERLVEKSSGHFIYASTVVKYIDNDFDRPQERLDVVANLRVTSQTPYAALDALYRQILTSSRADRALLVNIFSIILLDGRFDQKVFWHPVTTKSSEFIEAVLYLQPGEVQLALLDLRSLVGVEELKFWHKSFSDFLCDPRRSQEFCVYPGHARMLIAKCCLQLLSDETGLLSRSWFARNCKDPILDCHHLLSLSLKEGVPDRDVKSSMMTYEFNLMPFDHVPSSRYFGILGSCLVNYRAAESTFEPLNLVEQFHRQFDAYLLSELRRWVPLDSKNMEAVRALISPVSEDPVDYLTSRKLAENLSPKSDSPFLDYMAYPIYGYGFFGEFFSSKDRAHEYYLGKMRTQPSVRSAFLDLMKDKKNDGALEKLRNDEDTARSTTASGTKSTPDVCGETPATKLGSEEKDKVVEMSSLSEVPPSLNEGIVHSAVPSQQSKSNKLPKLMSFLSFLRRPQAEIVGRNEKTAHKTST